MVTDFACVFSRETKVFRPISSDRLDCLTFHSSSPWPHRSALQVRMSPSVTMRYLPLLIVFHTEPSILLNVGNRAIYYIHRVMLDNM